MFLCLQVNAQQRRKAVPQRRTTTSVKKNNPQAIKRHEKLEKMVSFGMNFRKEICMGQLILKEILLFQ